MKIDIVYLWVDGTDEKWRAEKDKWFEKITGKVRMGRDSAATERFRNNDELMYSLRSITENIPWVNHIYIVTGFGQVPKWLNTKNEKITIVSDTDILPPDALPTFNSVAIEMCLSKIPRLSEHFLLMNDDMFFNKKIPISYFFTRTGRTKYRYSSMHKLSEKELKQCTAYQSTIYEAQKAISNLFEKDFFKYTPSHGIDPYIKSSIIGCLNEPTLHDRFEKQIRNKFRTCDEFQRMIFNLYDLATGRAVFKHARARKYTRHKILNFIYNTLHFIGIRNSNVVCPNVVVGTDAISKAPTFCINDAPNNTPEILKKNREFLEQRFPNKCEFEK